MKFILSASNTVITTIKTAVTIWFSVPTTAPPFATVVAVAVAVAPAFFFCIRTSRESETPSLDHSFSLFLNSSMELYPFLSIISSNSLQILSKHVGPSVQWHVPTWTALAPHKIISKASIALFKFHGTKVQRGVGQRGRESTCISKHVSIR
jgi:hypothetical protein